MSIYTLHYYFANSKFPSSLAHWSSSRFGEMTTTSVCWSGCSWLLANVWILLLTVSNFQSLLNVKYVGTQTISLSPLFWNIRMMSSLLLLAQPHRWMAYVHTDSLELAKNQFIFPYWIPSSSLPVLHKLFSAVLNPE